MQFLRLGMLYPMPVGSLEVLPEFRCIVRSVFSPVGLGRSREDNGTGRVECDWMKLKYCWLTDLGSYGLE